LIHFPVREQTGKEKNSYFIHPFDTPFCPGADRIGKINLMPYTHGIHFLTREQIRKGNL
jgi:hypothetical protein